MEEMKNLEEPQEWKEWTAQGEERLWVGLKVRAPSQIP